MEKILARVSKEVELKIETIEFEYEHCGECSNCDVVFGKRGKTGNFPSSWKCELTGKKIPGLWGDIPEWCPLPDKETSDV